MPPSPQKQSRKPLGPVLDWTDEEIDQMSQISEADKKAAEALWHNEAPPALRNLLQAQGEETST